MANKQAFHVGPIGGMRSCKDRESTLDLVDGDFHVWTDFIIGRNRGGLGSGRTLLKADNNDI